jgi:phosphatidate cytidylyltransferase
LSNLTIRAIAGIIFTTLVISSALLGPYALGAVFFFFAIVGLVEFYQMVSKDSNEKPRVVFGYALGIALYIMIMFQAMDLLDSRSFWLLAPVFILLYIGELVHLDKRAVDHVSVTIMGLIYVVVPFAMINTLAFIHDEFEWEIPLGFFVILWGNDTAAYFTGRLLGRNKLYEKVSPNKTWEGLFGGVAFAVAGGWVLSKYFTALDTEQWMIVSAIIAVFANLGDLFESHLKRSYGVKDSGTIIPGHGGVLDRFDGLLLALPVVIFYLKFFNHS